MVEFLQECSIARAVERSIISRLQGLFSIVFSISCHFELICETSHWLNRTGCGVYSSRTKNKPPSCSLSFPKAGPQGRLLQMPLFLNNRILFHYSTLRSCIVLLTSASSIFSIKNQHFFHFTIHSLSKWGKRPGRGFAFFFFFLYIPKTVF